MAEGCRQKKKPANLLFIFSDQQSWDTLGCYGNDCVSTPHLDRLAGEGVRFRHCIANSPVCTPCRGMLLSGQHPLRHGAVANDWQMLPGGGEYFAEILKREGYRTGYVGKWHLFGGDRDRPIPAGPLRYGFDDCFLSNNCTLEYRAGKSHYWSEDGERCFYDNWEPDAQTDQALAFIDRCERDWPDQPWALFVSWHAPHNWVNRDSGYPRGSCYDAPSKYLSRYDLQSLRLRPNSPDTAEQRQIYRGYYALCSNLDDNVGRLLDRLSEQGLTEETMVVYTSDHGDSLGSTGRFNEHKCRPEDESVRVPLLVRAPGLSPRVSDLLVGSLDLMPTLLSLLGMEPPRSCDGVDLASAIRDGNDAEIDSIPLFLSHQDGHEWRGIYTRRYTYSFGLDECHNRLYDRQSDPWETENLFACPEMRAVREELHRQTLAWMSRFGDPFVPHQRLAELCLDDPEQARHPTPGATAVPRAHPVDLIREMQPLG